MDYEEIIYAKEAGLATITLNRPQRLNAYTRRMVDELLSAIEEVRRDDEVKVLVVTGAGRGFCTAGDIADFPPPPEECPPLRWVHEMRDGFLRVLSGLRYMDKLSIASINGPAVSGGMVLALACDFRIASDQARFGDVGLKYGFFPDEGQTYFLPRVVGIGKALELLLLSPIIDAWEALRIGLVHRVVPQEQLEQATRELALTLLRGPTVSQRLVKQTIYRQLDMDLESSLDYVSVAGEIVDKTEDAAEGARAFQEKREPVFKGR